MKKSVDVETGGVRHDDRRESARFVQMHQAVKTAAAAFLIEIWPPSTVANMPTKRHRNLRAVCCSLLFKKGPAS